ncbi:UNVERIFIED_CONTAM: hypothetical protein GTU68_010279 [Idotea baltica]|nr:hypothetical protein [Idotea baltica]
MINGRHFICISDFTFEEIRYLLDLAKEIKKSLKEGQSSKILADKTLAMVFQKPSMRTRVSFEVGMYQLGGIALNIRPTEIDMGKRETVPDVSRVLSSYVDAVMLRVVKHTDLIDFARNSSVPVINGLSDLYHPCQALADMLTIEEHLSSLKGCKLVYIGDGNNVANSLILASKVLGVEFTICCPKGFTPPIPTESGKYKIEHNPRIAVEGADVVYTDVWTSMGQEEETLQRLRAFDGYCVTKELLSLASPEVLFMHCLPAHRGEEVDEFVVDGPNSVVFQQAENRLHAQKALLAALLSNS